MNQVIQQSSRSNDAAAVASDPLRVASLADGALHGREADEVISLILRSPELRAAWDETHLVGDMVRSDDMAGSQDSDFMSRFAQRLDNEPTILSPRAMATGLRQRGWVRYGLPGISAAAAVAMVAWMAIPQLAGKGTAPVQQASIGTSVAAPVAAAPVQVAAMAPVAPIAPVDPRVLSEYLAAHQQYSVAAIHGPGYIQAASLNTVRVDAQEKP